MRGTKSSSVSNALGVLRVMREIRMQEHRFGTQLPCAAQRHGRVYIEHVRIARTAGHHPPLKRRTPHHHGTPDKRRIQQPLHRHEKRVHVEMHATCGCGDGGGHVFHS